MLSCVVYFKTIGRVNHFCKIPALTKPQGKPPKSTLDCTYLNSETDHLGVHCLKDAYDDNDESRECSWTFTIKNKSDLRTMNEYPHGKG